MPGKSTRRAVGWVIPGGNVSPGCIWNASLNVGNAVRHEGFPLGRMLRDPRKDDSGICPAIALDVGVVERITHELD